MKLIPLEKIHSSRDSVREVRESHLIDMAMTLEPNGLNHRDELLYCVSYHKFSNICKPEEGWYGQPKYCYEKTIHVVLISFAVVFGLLVFGYW